MWGRVLPVDVVRDAPRRLVVASAALLLLVGVSIILQGPVAWLTPGETVHPVALGLLGAQFVVSLVVLLASRRPDADPRRTIELGLWYEVFLAFTIAMEEFHPPLLADADFRGTSWVCLIIVLFPVLVPTAPRRTLAVSMLAASMGPLALVLYGTAGYLPGFSFMWLVPVCIQFYMTALLALAPAIVISRLGSDLAEARTVGCYTLEEKLGEGGMGQVWRARHQLLRRPAAVKVISAESMLEAGEEAGAAKRFEREAQATAILRSPHTITLYDFGVADDGTFYYVMELLEGLDLETLVARFGPVPAGRCIHLLRQVCLSLDEAHASGMVHRDIKPANIYACRLGRQVDFVKVLDFGLVKLDVRSGESCLTAVGTISGTPDYMAPEQVRGETVNDLTDIYALGCVGYWLLTGCTVFPVHSMMEKMMAHMALRPVPPSQHVAGIPSDLEAVIMACLEKAPADRPQGALHLDTLLADCASAREWGDSEARGWWREHLPEPGRSRAGGSQGPGEAGTPGAG